MKLGKREKILAAAFGLFIVLFTIERGLFRPFLSKLETVDARIKTSELKIKKLLNIDSQKEDITKLFDKIKDYIQAGVTEEEALAVITKEVEEMAKSSRIALLNMRPDTETEEIRPGCRAKRVDLDIEGSQRNIVTFLYKLENSNYPLSIERLSFKIKDKKASLMEADLNIRFIYFLY